MGAPSPQDGGWRPTGGGSRCLIVLVELVRVGHRLAPAGLVSLACTMLAGVLLVLDVVVGRVGAITATGMLLAVFVALWVGLPLQLRRP